MHGILELSGEAPIKKFGNFESKTYQKKQSKKKCDFWGFPIGCQK